MIDLALDSRIYLQNDIDLALQELDILFNTTNTELIGYVDFGTNFEQFLWQLTPSPDELKKYISNRINEETLYLKTMNVDIYVTVNNNGYEGLAYNINIALEDESSGQKISRIYNIK